MPHRRRPSSSQFETLVAVDPLDRLTRGAVAAWQTQKRDSAALAARFHAARHSPPSRGAVARMLLLFGLDAVVSAEPYGDGRFRGAVSVSV
jgi:hypothetical protein